MLLTPKFRNMDTRTKEYIARKKAFEALPKQPNIKNLLKTSFFASRSVIVKKDILKTYEELNQLNTGTASQQTQSSFAS